MAGQDGQAAGRLPHRGLHRRGSVHLAGRDRQQPRAVARNRRTPGRYQVSRHQRRRPHRQRRQGHHLALRNQPAHSVRYRRQPALEELGSGRILQRIGQAHHHRRQHHGFRNQRLQRNAVRGRPRMETRQPRPQCGVSPFGSHHGRQRQQHGDQHLLDA